MATSVGSDDQEEEDRIYLERRKKIDKAVAFLMEDFDTVHIFVSKFETNGSTFDASCGDGNLLARKAQAREWVLITDERLKCHVWGE